MNALFGEEHADALRAKLNSLSSRERELVIVEEICRSLRELAPEYVLPFRFKDDHGTRTSHHLVFVSKAFKGYEIMKQIMAGESSANEQGVASFEYNPVETRFAEKQQLLFELSRPLDELGDMLLKEFAGQKLRMHQVYEQHNVGRRYIKTNYKQALRQLEEEGKITASKHRKGTFGDKVQVIFPKIEGL